MRNRVKPPEKAAHHAEKGPNAETNPLIEN